MRTISVKDGYERPEVTEALNELSRQLLHETIQAEREPWKYAYFQMIWSAGAASANYFCKFRWMLVDGTVVGRIHPPKPIIRHLDSVRENRFRAGDLWYGLKLVIFPDGRYEVAVDFDPDCESKNEVDFYAD